MGLKAYVTCMTSQDEVNRQLLLCVRVCARVHVCVCVCVFMHVCCVSVMCVMESTHFHNGQMQYQQSRVISNDIHNVQHARIRHSHTAIMSKSLPDQVASLSVSSQKSLTKHVD